MFSFFKVIPLNKNVKQGSKVIANSNNSSYKVLCSLGDKVQIFYGDWEYINLHMKDLKFCCVPENSENIILLSQTNGNKITLRFYDICADIGRKIAVLNSSCVLESENKVTALSALISESQLFISIGLDNGNIYFYKSTLQKDIPANAFKYYNVATKPIKGIKFSKSKGNVIMFVCSDAAITCYTISNNLKYIDNKLILDDVDSCIHCVTMIPSIESDEEQYLVVARDDGLYCYTEDGRGPCFAINGYKKNVEWFGKYLIILLEGRPSIHHNTSDILVYDIDTKIIVLNKNLDDVKCLLPCLGNTNCFILLKSGEILTLRERDLRYKLSILLKKNLYDIAIKILDKYESNIDVSNILLQYGDYMLQRGDLTGAITVYSQTIGNTPPYIIIKKFMDFRYNELLIQYLSKLVKTKFHIPEHLDLLNKCFQRKNLTVRANSVFDTENSKLKQPDYVRINPNEHFSDFFNNVNENVCQNFFNEITHIEVIEFLSEYGYFLIKKYPTKLKYIINNSFPVCSSKNDVFVRILLPLSLINKLCIRHFIEDLLKHNERNTINILTEIILQMWSTGCINTNVVIKFLSTHQSEISIDNMFVLSRSYKFWPAIKMIYDKYNMEVLSTHYLAKCLVFFSDYIDIYTEKCKKLNHLFQVLKREMVSKSDTSKYIIYVVKKIIKSNPYCILNTINSIATCNKILISQLIEFNAQEKILSYFKCDELYSTVSCLENRVNQKEEVLRNYFRRPMEFRNRSCDICQQFIKLPSVYFLCQHSFHKECFLQFSEVSVCVVCKNLAKPNKTHFKNSDHENINNSHNYSKNAILKEISTKIGQMPFKNYNQVVGSKPQKKIENLAHSNPFQNDTVLKCCTNDLYDDNLNPFSNK